MTTIPGPYEHIEPDDRKRIQANISDTAHERLFHNLFPRRGSQDRIIGMWIAFLYKLTEDFETGDSLTNERLLLERIGPHLYIPQQS